MAILRDCNKVKRCERWCGYMSLCGECRLVMNEVSNNDDETVDEYEGHDDYDLTDNEHSESEDSDHEENYGEDTMNDLAEKEQKMRRNNE